MRLRTILGWMGCTAMLAGAPTLASTALHQVHFDIKAFSLEHEGNTYSLRSADGVNLKVPADWLQPPDEHARPTTGASAPSLDSYNKQVTSFPIGDGRIGIHLSSYDIQSGETGQIAMGRDVFLIFDPQAASLRNSGLQLGITKERSQVDGRVSATAHTFFIGDINGDGLMDLGVIKEEITWKRRLRGLRDRDALAGSAGPAYRQHAIRWHLLAGDPRQHQPQYDGKYPSGDYQKLPLIGLVKSPVDFVDETIYPGIRKGSTSDISRTY